MTIRFLPVILLPALVVSPEIFAQIVPQLGSTVSLAGSREISLAVADGTALQIALDKEVRVRKIGEPITGRVMQPVYVFDREVIPLGTVARGAITRIDPVSCRQRFLRALNADFTPSHNLVVEFSELDLPDGRHLKLHTNTVPGSGQVLRLLTAGEKEKHTVKDAASQQMNQVRNQWNRSMSQIQSPYRIHVAMRYAVAQLPAHPQYIDAGTFYFAELSQPLYFGTASLDNASLSQVGTRPPPGSLVHAALLHSLNSATTRKGEQIEASLSQPLFDQGHLILPAGTHLRGIVLQVQAAKRWHRNGQLRISFREVLLPNGTVEAVDTRLQGIESDSADNARLDSEGGAKSTPSTWATRARQLEGPPGLS